MSLGKVLLAMSFEACFRVCKQDASMTVRAVGMLEADKDTKIVSCS